jgi:molybdenum cofactor guanylyltransferase
MSKINLPCIILAGGKSSRMKQDKALLSFEKSDSLAKHVYHNMCDLFEKVYISCKADKFDFKAPLILDESSTYAPTIALEAILKQFNGHVFIIAVDMPFVSKETVMTLYDAIAPTKIVIAKEGETSHNMCGFYHSDLIPSLQIAIQKEQHALHRLLRGYGAIYVDIDDHRSFTNLNTPEEYQEALK